MSEEKFRGDENWLEEHLPLKWGGLRVFLWGLVYLLVTCLMFITGSLNKNDRLFEEDPAIVAVLITNSIAWVLITAASVLHAFIETDSKDDFTHFPWAYLQKYWCNNVVGRKLVFSSNNEGVIRVNIGEKESFLIREGEKTKNGIYGIRTEAFIQFTIRCGGWFWRRSTKGWCNRAAYIDFSEALKVRDSFAVYSFENFSSSMKLPFGDFGELMDFWHSDVSRNVKNSLKKCAELTTKVTELEAELKKCRELIGEKDMHISEFGRHMLELYQVIAVSIAESSRLAINRESSVLLRKLLVMGIDMRAMLWHEFEHNPLKLDPPTNASLEEIFKLCEHYIKHLDEVARKAAQEKELKAKPKNPAPSADDLPAPQDPPA